MGFHRSPPPAHRLVYVVTMSLATHGNSPQDRLATHGNSPQDPVPLEFQEWEAWRGAPRDLCLLTWEAYQAPRRMFRA